MAIRSSIAPDRVVSSVVGHPTCGRGWLHINSKSEDTKIKPHRVNLVQLTTIGANEGGQFPALCGDIAAVVQRPTLPTATMIDCLRLIHGAFFSDS